MTDVLDSDGVILLAKNVPNNKVTDFLDWFLYSDNAIDGQSKKKAYTLFESGLLDDIEPGMFNTQFCASKGLFLPLKTPFWGLFGDVFTGFYKNAKSYIIEY